MSNLSENFLQAIETIVEKRLGEVNFDTTIVCEVLSNTNKDKNEYTVSNGNTAFTAYSNGEMAYVVGQKVYVTVPCNNYSLKKIIVGSYTSDDTSAYQYINPWERIVTVGGNLVSPPKNVDTSNGLPAAAIEIEASNSEDSIKFIGEGDDDYQVLYGDINDDGYVNAQENISTIRDDNYLLYNTQFGNIRYPLNQNCDFNNDGILDSQDAIELSEIELNGEAVARYFPISSIPLEIEDNKIKYIAIKATFETYLESTKGNYGLVLSFFKEAISKPSYQVVFDSSEFYGNPYYYDGGFEQQKIVSYPEDADYGYLTIGLYQKGNFNNLGDNNIITARDINISLAYDQADFKEDSFTIKLDKGYSKEYGSNDTPVRVTATYISYNNEIQGYENKQLNPNSLSWYRYRVGNGNVGGGAHWELLLKYDETIWNLHESLKKNKAKFTSGDLNRSFNIFQNKFNSRDGNWYGYLKNNIWQINKLKALPTNIYSYDGWLYYSEGGRKETPLENDYKIESSVLSEIENNIIQSLENLMDSQFISNPFENIDGKFVGKTGKNQYRIISFPYVSYQNEQLKAIYKDDNKILTSNILKWEYKGQATGEDSDDVNHQITLKLNNIGHYPAYGEDNYLFSDYNNSDKTITADFADSTSWENVKSIEWRIPVNSLVSVQEGEIQDDYIIIKKIKSENENVPKTLTYTLKNGPWDQTKAKATIYCYVVDETNNESSEKVTLQFSKYGSSGTDYSIRLTDDNNEAPWSVLKIGRLENIKNLFEASIGVTENIVEGNKETEGDLNNDSFLNSADAIYLLYHVLFGAKKYPLPKGMTCDYNKDGKVTSADAIYLLYRVLFGENRYPIGRKQEEINISEKLDNILNRIDSEEYRMLSNNQNLIKYYNLLKNDYTITISETGHFIYTSKNEEETMGAEHKILRTHLYDPNGVEIELTSEEQAKFKWEWVHDFSKDNNATKIGHETFTENTAQKEFWVESMGEYCNAILKVSYEGFNISETHEVDLVCYHPIAVTNILDADSITGATEVVYDTNGNIASYDDRAYNLLGVDGETIEFNDIQIRDSKEQKDVSLPGLQYDYEINESSSNDISLKLPSSLSEEEEDVNLVWIDVEGTDYPISSDYWDISSNDTNGEKITTLTLKSRPDIFFTYKKNNDFFSLTNGNGGERCWFTFQLNSSINAGCIYKTSGDRRCFFHIVENPGPDENKSNIYLSDFPMSKDISVTNNNIYFVYEPIVVGPSIYLKEITKYKTSLKPSSTTSLRTNLENQWSSVIFTKDTSVFQQPILLRYNRYGIDFLNEWDGGYTVDVDNNAVYSALLVTGEKNEENKFTGVVIGDVGVNDQDKLYGVYGYKEGVKSFSIDENGDAYLAGGIEADYGKFGAFIIDSEQITNSAEGTKKFSITPEGVFEFSGGTINNCTIQGGTLTPENLLVDMNTFESETTGGVQQVTKNKITCTHNSSNNYYRFYSNYDNNTDATTIASTKIRRAAETSTFCFQEYKINTNEGFTITFADNDSKPGWYVSCGVSVNSIIQNVTTNNPTDVGMKTAWYNGQYRNTITVPAGCKNCYLFRQTKTNQTDESDKAGTYVDVQDTTVVITRGHQFTLEPGGEVTISGGILNNCSLNNCLDEASQPVTSDRTLKHSILPLSTPYLNLLKSVEPVTYKYNEGTSDRLHTGFIAQQIEEVLPQCGLTSQDFAALVINKNTGHYALRYEEFIALNTLAIQDLYKIIESLQAKIVELENKLQQQDT